MKRKLTVLITCKNEARNIVECIESIRSLADEILVADSGSTDNTLDLVRKIGGCRIIERDVYISAGNFKNWAIPQATHDWILVVDSDERVTPQLAAEVRAALAGMPEYDAYQIRFKAFFLGHQIKYCGWNTTTAIRLFNRQVCRYRERRVHADVDVSTRRVGTMKGKNLHFTCPDLTEYFEKVNNYTSWGAKDMHSKGRRVTFLGLLCRAPFRFFQVYVLRGGFLDGSAGLVVCSTTAYYTFLKYAKLWQLQHQSHTESVAAPNRGGPLPGQSRNRHAA